VAPLAEELVVPLAEELVVPLAEELVVPLAEELLSERCAITKRDRVSSSKPASMPSRPLLFCCSQRAMASAAAAKGSWAVGVLVEIVQRAKLRDVQCARLEVHELAREGKLKLESPARPRGASHVDCAAALVSASGSAAPTATANRRARAQRRLRLPRSSTVTLLRCLQVGDRSHTRGKMVGLPWTGNFGWGLGTFPAAEQTPLRYSKYAPHLKQRLAGWASCRFRAHS
jgi:hypothetical protein